MKKILTLLFCILFATLFAGNKEKKERSLEKNNLSFGIWIPAE
ncbi:hypothetical protein [Chryseobacterium sp.]